MKRVRSDDKNLPLYYIALFSRNKLAHDFWDDALKYGTDQTAIQLGLIHVTQLPHRMDRRDLESRPRLHKISPGCKHCYAETFAERFRGVKGHPYEQGFDLRLVPEKLTEPFRLALPEAGVRELDERSVSGGRAGRLRGGRLARDGDGELAHLSGADEEIGEAAAVAQRQVTFCGGAGKHLVGRQR